MKMIVKDVNAPKLIVRITRLLLEISDKDSIMILPLSLPISIKHTLSSKMAMDKAVYYLLSW